MDIKIKSVAKNIIGAMSPLACGKSHLSSVEARNILNTYSECPVGTCKADNHIDINYILQ